MPEGTEIPEETTQNLAERIANRELATASLPETEETTISDARDEDFLRLVEMMDGDIDKAQSYLQSVRDRIKDEDTIAERGIGIETNPTNEELDNWKKAA